MFKVNENFAKLPGSYLFAGIAKKVAAFQEAHPETEIIRLGIGDVTQPLAPAIIEAMHQAVDEMGKAETFRGYAPEQGYEALKEYIDFVHNYQGCQSSNNHGGYSGYQAK